MLRHFLLATGLVLLPAIASAQELSGTWVRDGARSDVVPNSMYWTTQGVDSGGTRGPNTQFVIEVEQTADSLRVTDPTRPLRVYPLDGQAHTVPADTGIVDATITASVQGDAVVVERAQTYSGLPGGVILNTEENWQLGADGNSLVITTSRETPAKTFTYTEVYTRQ